MSEIMQGKWNHSKKPSEYEVFDSDGELLYSGAFVDAMKYMEENKMEIMDDYDAGFNDGRNNLALDLMNHFNKKIEELKENDHPANNAHISALESFIETVQKTLSEKNS